MHKLELAVSGTLLVDSTSSIDVSGQGIGSAMLELIENRAAELGAEELALDTAEGAIHLIDYYKKRGYRFIEYVDWDITNYRSVILSKRL